MRTLTIGVLSLSSLVLAACGTATRESADTRAEATRPAETAAASFQPDMVMTVHGMGCPLCAENIELKLRNLQGVGEIAIDLGRGTVSVAFLPGPHATVEELAETVRDAGFTVKDVRTL